MNKPAEEWEDMNEKTQNEIKARLMAACDTEAVDREAVVLGYRQRLERASRVNLGWVAGR